MWDVLGQERDPGPDARMGISQLRRKKVECRVGAKEENVLEMLEVLREEYSGAREYVRTRCRLEEWDIDAVKRAMTVDVRPVHYARDSGCWE